MSLKNPERSRLAIEYNSQVSVYNQVNKRVIQNKYEMSYLWKYKNDYPADWKRKVKMLTDDRKQLKELKYIIRSLKANIRKCNSEYAQNIKKTENVNS